MFLAFVVVVGSVAVGVVVVEITLAVVLWNVFAVGFVGVDVAVGVYVVLDMTFVVVVMLSRCSQCS